MVYMTSLHLLTIVVAFLGGRMVYRTVKRRQPLTPATVFPFYLEVLPAALVAVPFALHFMKEHVLRSGGAVSVGGSHDTLLTALGGIAGVIIYGRGLLRNRSEGSLLVGAYSFALLVSAYMLIVAADQHAFFRNPSDAGAVSWSFIKEQGGVNDVECQSDMLVVRGVDTGVVEYRCPTGAVFSIFSGRPFVPWPDYTEGESGQLARAIQKLRDHAVKE